MVPEVSNVDLLGYLILAAGILTIFKVVKDTVKSILGIGKPKKKKHRKGQNRDLLQELDDLEAREYGEGTYI